MMSPTAFGNPVNADVLESVPAAVDPLALSLNENPFSPLPAVRSALHHAMGAVNRYPEFLPDKLRAMVANHIGVDAGQVALGSGATGVAMQVLQTFTRPGDRIVLSDPTFDGFPIMARMAGLASIPIPLDPHGHDDLPAMADAAVGARVVVLCRPHNPTGTLAPIADVERFLRRLPVDTIVLFDEAYIEFVAPSTASVDRIWFDDFRMSSCCAPSPKPTVWRAYESGTDSAHRSSPIGCGPCNCRSLRVSAARSRWQPPTKPKTNCGNGPCVSQASGRT